MTDFWEITVKKLKVLNKSKNAYKSYTHLFKGKQNGIGINTRKGSKK